MPIDAYRAVGKLCLTGTTPPDTLQVSFQQPHDPSEAPESQQAVWLVPGRDFLTTSSVRNRKAVKTLKKL